MNELTTALTANVVVPNTSDSVRSQTTWYTRPQAPDRKKRARSSGYVRERSSGIRLLGAPY